MSDVAHIRNVRALLREFERSTLKACHVVVHDLEIFFSRDPSYRACDAGDRPPMGGSTSTATSSHSPALVGTPTAASAAATADLLAPHVGTLVHLAALNTPVAKGESVARLAVLDEQFDVCASAPCIVTEHRRQPGELVEFGQPIAVLSQVGRVGP